MNKILIALIATTIAAQAATYVIEIPDEDAALVMQAVAYRKGWGPIVHKLTNGDYQYYENGSPIMIENPVNAAFITRKAVIDFLKSETQSYQLETERAKVEKEIRNSIKTVDIL